MPKTAKRAAKKAYHHGDLRRALLEASIQLIGERGVEALSLREVAQQIGVSPAAPYHHFGSKSVLLGAIAARGFAGLTESMQGALAALPTGHTAIDRLAAIGDAYLGFALAHPTEYRLMFSPGLVSPADLPPDCEPEGSYAVLLEAVARVAETLRPGVVDPDALTATCWSLVHGAALLILDGPLGETGRSPDTLRLGVIGTLRALLSTALPTKRQ